MNFLDSQSLHTLSKTQKESFLDLGFVKLEAAFPKEIAAKARTILWQESGCNPNDRTTWTLPVVRLGDHAEEPFRRAINSPALHQAFDALVGKHQWLPRQSIGTFPIRFPHNNTPGDTGWHVDASFPPETPTESYFDWRINVRSKGRALLMLFLFSDVGEEDAPTRIRVSSHLEVARLLAPYGEPGLSLLELSQKAEQVTRGLPEMTATGSAGTVYLCHPFLLHAAQAHRGITPRFLAQPPLLWNASYEPSLTRENPSLVEQAIQLALTKI